jgi:hypothetical protein
VALATAGLVAAVLASDSGDSHDRSEAGTTTGATTGAAERAQDVPPGGKQLSEAELEAERNKEAGVDYDKKLFKSARQKRVHNEKVAKLRDRQKRQEQRGRP